MIASYSPASSFARRVLTLPRSARNSSARIARAAAGIRGAGSRCRRARRPAALRGSRSGSTRRRRAASSRAPNVASVELRRQHHRHVLHRVHRDVGAALVERDLELLDEEALAADLRERPVEHAVALGGHAERVSTARPGWRARSARRPSRSGRSARRLSRVAMRMSEGVADMDLEAYTSRLLHSTDVRLERRHRARRALRCGVRLRDGAARQLRGRAGRGAPRRRPSASPSRSRSPPSATPWVASTTYALGRLLPGAQAAFGARARGGAPLRRLALLLSWVPVAGDALCAAAGWLRMPRVALRVGDGARQARALPRRSVARRTPLGAPRADCCSCGKISVRPQLTDPLADSNPHDRPPARNPLQLHVVLRPRDRDPPARRGRVGTRSTSCASSACTGRSARMLYEVLGDIWVVRRNPYLQDDLLDNPRRLAALIERDAPPPRRDRQAPRRQGRRRATTAWRALLAAARAAVDAFEREFARDARAARRKVTAPARGAITRKDNIQFDGWRASRT